MTESKEFSAPHGDIRVALLNGQATVITSTPKALPECFWGPAYAAGAVSGDMTKSSEADKQEKARLKELDNLAKDKEELTICLKEIFEEPGAFVGQDGTPVARKVSAKLGRSVTKPEVLEVWNIIVEAK